MMKKRIYLILTGLLCALLLIGTAPKTALLRPCALETFPGATTPEPTDPDAGFNGLPEPPSAADAKEDVEAVLQEVEQEKEEYRENTDISGVRTGMIIGAVILIGICGAAIYFFKFRNR